MDLRQALFFQVRSTFTHHDPPLGHLNDESPRLTFDGDLAGLRSRIAPRRQIRAVLDRPLRHEDLPTGATLDDPRTALLEASEEELEGAVASVLALGGIRDLSVQEVDLDVVMANAYAEQADRDQEQR
ncbi:hypothetical protein CIK81_02940 [Brachybacterium sp. JB7]|nr:hypothetical protein CIK81_02940 [Brachybacterium sp. JB7]